MKIGTAQTVAALAVLLACSGAHAAVTQAKYCSHTGDGTSATVTATLATGTFSTSDVTYGIDGPGGTTASATDCYGLINSDEGASGGNSSASIINDIWGDNSGADISWGNGEFFELVKKNTGQSGAGNTILGYQWSLDGSTAATTGTWTLTADPLTGLPKYFDFVAVLKGSSDSVAYLFDEAFFDGSSGGSWTMQIDADGGSNQKFNRAELSNLTIYGRAGTTTSSNGGTPGSGSSSTSGGTVPEPSSGPLVALALGLLGAGYWMRRRGQRT